MKVDLLKEFYFFELDRKQQLESSLVLPVAVLTGLGGVVFSFAKLFRYGFNLKTYVFVVALLGATISLVWVLFHLIRGIHGFTYEVIPSSQELLSFWEQSKDYYRSLGAEFKADEDFDLEMKRSYAKATSKNGKNNLSKARFLYNANLGLVSAALFLAVSAAPYFFDDRAKPAPMQKIELINAQDLKTLQGVDMPDNQTKPCPSPTQNPQPQQKPVFPSNTTTREGEQPRKPVFPTNRATKDANEVIIRKK